MQSKTTQGLDIHTLQFMIRWVEATLKEYLPKHSPGLYGDDPYVHGLLEVRDSMKYFLEQETKAMDEYFEIMQKESE